MSSFSDEISALCAREARRAGDDPDAWGEMIERLATVLGMTVAMAAKGNAKAIDELLLGLEIHIAAEAAAVAPIARLNR